MLMFYSPFDCKRNTKSTPARCHDFVTVNGIPQKTGDFPLQHRIQQRPTLRIQCQAVFNLKAAAICIHNQNVRIA
jgi:hypothetical protein